MSKLSTVSVSSRSEPLSRADGLARQLAKEIIDGKLAPGERLDEQETAARFGVSRTPLREAYRQLQAMGLVERRPNRGVIVASPSTRQLEEMFVAMGELEATMARLAAIMMTAEERRALHAMHTESAALVRAGALDAYATFNVAFHSALYAGARNSYLEDLTSQTRRRLAPYRRAQFNVLGRLADSWSEHDRVVTAILRADGDGAAHAVRAHMTTVGVTTRHYVSARSRQAATDTPADQ